MNSVVIELKRVLIITEKDLVPTPNNVIELRQRSQDGMDSIAYTADNDALKIHKSGKLVEWHFYSIYDGEVAFQVWRKSQKKYCIINYLL